MFVKNAKNLSSLNSTFLLAMFLLITSRTRFNTAPTPRSTTLPKFSVYKLAIIHNRKHTLYENTQRKPAPFSIRDLYPHAPGFNPVTHLRYIISKQTWVEPAQIQPAGMSQPGMSQPGMSQPGMSQPGMSQPGMSQPGMSQPRMIQPGISPPGMSQPGMTQPGMSQPWMTQPRLGQPGFNQPGFK